MADETMPGSASGTRGLAERFDVIIVGARCAGSPLATLLARAGPRVCVVDRARFPSDTASTTFSCEMTRLAAGASTGACRETASSVVQAFLGRGEARIGEETFAWNAGDLLAIPHWTSWELRAAADAEEPAYLFTMTDRPTMQALGFYRIQEH